MPATSVLSWRGPEAPKKDVNEFKADVTQNGIRRIPGRKKDERGTAEAVGTPAELRRASMISDAQSDAIFAALWNKQRAMFLERRPKLSAPPKLTEDKFCRAQTARPSQDINLSDGLCQGPTSAAYLGLRV